MLGFCIENLMFAFGDSEFGSFDDFIVLITSHLPFKESTVLYCTNLNTDPVLHLVTIGACGTFCKEAICQSKTSISFNSAAVFLHELPSHI